MTYEQAVAFLRGREQFHVRTGLRNIRNLLAALGNPETGFPSILVAGTNGKGSTVAILDAVLRAHGLSVGRLTSPHLVDVTERIHFDGAPVPRERLASLVGEVAAVSAGFAPEFQPSFFETLTGAAFLGFAHAGVDAAVLEVGMGGRWDATAAADAGLALVTRIALDHERFLGGTIAEIAAEKGAVARPGGELVVAAQGPAARRVLAARAREHGAAFLDAAAETECDLRIERFGARGSLRTLERSYEDLWLPLPGAHQLENLALAGFGLERFAARRGMPPPDPERFRAGLADVRWPGRLQWTDGPGGTALLLDAAHNPAGAACLADYLGRLGPRPPRTLVFGVSRGKRAAPMLAPLLPHADAVFLTAAESSRALPAEELRETVSAVVADAACPVEVVPNPGSALDRAARSAGASGEVVVAGSIFLLGDVFREIHRLPFSDIRDAEAMAPAR